MEIHIFHHVDPGGPEITHRLDAINRKLDLVLQRQGTINMATQQELDALAAAVAQNTDAAASASMALTGFVKTVADLTAALQQAIANGDSAAIKAAADAIAANNATLQAAIPPTSQAVAKNLRP